MCQRQRESYGQLRTVGGGRGERRCLGLAAHEEVEGGVEVLAAVMSQGVHIQLVLSGIQGRM